MPLLFELGSMDGIPKEIDPQLLRRCARIVSEHP